MLRRLGGGPNLREKNLWSQKMVRCESQDVALRHIQAVPPIKMTLTVSLRAIERS